MSVITGVVVPFATVELKSAPVVPNVNAATLVTVPPLDGAELVTVKLGYVPVTPIPVPAAIATTWSGAEFVTVTAVVAPDTEIPVPAVNPLVAREGPVPSFTKDSVPPAEDNETPDVGSVLLIVKLGYVPATPIPEPAAKATVWSGAVLVIVKLGYVPDVDIPVPELNTTVWSGAVFAIVWLG